MNTFRSLLSANEFRVDSSPAQDLTHRANALWLLTLVALFGLVTGCGGNSTQPPATIAFESSRALDGSDAVTGAGNIWLVKSDGSGATPLTKLTAGGAADFDVVWSPDGSKLAFDSFRALDGSNAANPNNTFNVWVVNADGSGAKPLTTITAVSLRGSTEPHWSPDGQKLAFGSDRALDGSDAAFADGTENIWLVNADGSGTTPVTKLTTVGGSSFSPRWSPDGSKIAFLSLRALDGSDAGNRGGCNVWMVNSDGSGATPLTRLTSPVSCGDSLAWSPDGSKLVYESTRALDGTDASNGSANNFWMMSADGSGATPLTRYNTFNQLSEIVWAPDGSKLAFVSDRALDGADAANTNSSLNLWVVNATGSAATPLTMLTASRVNAFNPRWAPDGSELSFSSNRSMDGGNAANTNGAYNIWLVNADGSSPVPVTGLQNASSFLAEWKP